MNKAESADGILFGGEYWYMDPAKADPGPAKVRETALPLPETEDKVVNLNEGHRARLRERFRQDQSFDNFRDHEILELLMTYASPRRDTKNAAKNLLNTYGNLKGVFEAPPSQLMKTEGVGEVQATLLSMMLPLTRVVRKCEMMNPKQIANRKELEHYCMSMQLGKRTEEFWVICVNAQCRVLGQQKISSGSLSEVSAYPRMVMETVLNYNAHSVFFCHNHPGGTCAPSQEDVATTLQLQRMLSTVDVLVLDHMIIAGDKAYSMAQRGDMEFGARGRR